MSQRYVERVMGRLVTDEEFRRRFARDPAGVLGELAGGGVELNPCEMRALAALDPELVERFARELDPRLLKADLRGCPD